MWPELLIGRYCLTHWAMELGMHGNPSFSNGSGIDETGLEENLKAHVFCMSKWPIYPPSLYLIHCLLSLYLYLWSFREFLVTKWWRKRTLRPNLHVVLHYRQTLLKRAQLRSKWTEDAQNPHSEVVLKNKGEGKPSTYTEFWALHLVVHFAWKERYIEVQVYTDSWVMANTWLESQEIWKECDWKIGDKEIWKERLTDLFKWVWHV